VAQRSHSWTLRHTPRTNTAAPVLPISHRGISEWAISLTSRCHAKWLVGSPKIDTKTSETSLAPTAAAAPQIISRVLTLGSVRGCRPSHIPKRKGAAHISAGYGPVSSVPVRISHGGSAEVTDPRSNSLSVYSCTRIHNRG